MSVSRIRDSEAVRFSTATWRLLTSDSKRFWNAPNTTGAGWLGRYLSALGGPLDPLAAWTATSDTPHVLQAPGIAVAAVPIVAGYAFSSPNSNVPAEAKAERAAAANIASHVPVGQPHVAFVASAVQAALDTLDRVATVAQYRPSVSYPNNGFAQALQAVAGAMAKGLGTKVFFVTTGGFDTHASQETIAENGT